MEPDWQIGRLLGSGQVAEVFEFGPHVIKLFRSESGKSSAFREASTLVALEDTGLPVPIVHAVTRIENHWGVVMTRAPAATADFMSSPTALAALHAQLHALSGDRLGSLKSKLARDIARAPRLSDSERTTLLSRLATLPDGGSLCHGDFHPGNVMGSFEAPCIVDWVDATSGPPEADACRTYLLVLNNLPEFAGPYLDAYVSASGRAREDVLAWLPVVAAARLAENVTREEGRLLEVARGEGS